VLRDYQVVRQRLQHRFAVRVVLTVYGYSIRIRVLFLLLDVYSYAGSWLSFMFGEYHEVQDELPSSSRLNGVSLKDTSLVCSRRIRCILQ
jgi:hypothetical protein